MVPLNPSPDSPFAVTFGEGTVVIDSEDLDVLREIRYLLRHCRSPVDHDGVGTGVTSLAVRMSEDGGRIITKDGQIILRSSSAAALIERILYETTVNLARANRSSLVLHAAGVALGTAGVALCGESGAGKSTLAARSILGGFNLLSDELILVDPSLGTMSGFPRPLVLKDVVAGLGTDNLPVQIQSPAVIGEVGNSYVDPEQIRSGCVQPGAEVAVLVFPRYSPNSNPVIQRLSPAAAAFRLLPRVVNAPNLPRRGLDAVTALAKRVPAYAAAYSDASLIVPVLHQLVDSPLAARHTSHRPPRV